MKFRYNIVDRDRLLADIVDGLKPIRGRVELGDIEVAFGCGKKLFTFGLVQALEVLTNDLYFDERGNWADADRALVRTF